MGIVLEKILTQKKVGYGRLQEFQVSWPDSDISDRNSRIAGCDNRDNPYRQGDRDCASDSRIGSRHSDTLYPLLDLSPWGSETISQDGASAHSCALCGNCCGIHVNRADEAAN